MLTLHNIGTNFGPLLIRNDYLRFLYTSMLLEFSSEEMQEFWQMHHLRIDGRLLSEKEFFEYIWEADNKTDFNFVFRVLDSVENFFLSKQRLLVPFLDKNLGNVEKGTPLGPQIALWAIYPVLKLLFNAKDVETIFLKNLHIINERVRPGTFQKLLGIQQTGTGNLADVLFSPDPSFKNDLHMIDGELFFAKTLQHAVTRFGLSPTPFHSCEMLSECQDSRSRLDGFGSWRKTGDEIIVDGRPIGKAMEFSEFLKQRGIDIAKHIDCPNRIVEVMTEQHYCPKRQRVILHKNCAYGAPVYLYRMSYTPERSELRLLEKLFDHVLVGIEPEATKIGKLHEGFILSLSPQITFRFDTPSQYLFVNDQYLTQGKQACILVHILRSYKEDGRTVFDHKEFTKNTRFISSPKRPGFVPRLDRVAALLKKTCPPVALARVSRGKFRLNATAPIDLQVVE